MRPTGVLTLYVEWLSLTDYRNYRGIQVDLGPGVVSFIGSNGQGKTNLVEGVAYISTLSSHRVASDAPLVFSDAPRATNQLDRIGDQSGQGESSAAQWIADGATT